MKQKLYYHSVVCFWLDLVWCIMTYRPSETLNISSFFYLCCTVMDLT